jgi:hypothetical protein
MRLKRIQMKISKSICLAAAGSALALPGAPAGLSPLARISAPMFVRCENQLWGLCWFGGDGGGEFGRIAPGRPGSEASSGASPQTGSSCCGGLPAAAAAVSPGMGWAAGPHVLAAGPRRADDRQAPLHGGHGLAVRPANPRGGHLLGLAPDTDWIRNIRVRPALQVQVGRQSFTPQQRFLSEEESLAVVAEFWHRHPGRLRLITSILGWGDLRSDAAARDFVSTRPFVSFRPADPSRARQGHADGE